MKIKNLIFLQKFTRYKENIIEQNYLFEEDLQICYWLFSHRSYIFSFIRQESFYENQKFNFPAKIHEIQKNVIEQNYSFEEDLQIGCWLFSHKSYIFSFIRQERFYENQKFNYLA